MSYECQWMPSAESALEEILHSAAEPAKLAQSLKKLEQEIVADPLAVGESRGHDLERIAFTEGVAILFYVKANEPTVVVYGVWRTH